MKILINDILSRAKYISGPSELSNLLLQLGHENEIDKNYINLELTPNRGDCFSLLGILRDLNSLTETNTHFPTYQNKIEEYEIDFKNYIPDVCPKITFAIVEIKNSTDDYKDYLSNYFEELGNNKVNFFTDVSNYLSYEIGQPTHCYDVSKINGSIKLEQIQEEKLFNTLINKEIKLSNSDYAFTIDNEVINLAGIMGGSSTACSKKTTKILLECAYFNSESIIGKNLKYNLNSEAAHKFERGTDPFSHDFTLRRFLNIVQDHTEIASVKSKTFLSKDIESKFIEYDFNKIKKILGLDNTTEVFQNYLLKLGFKFNENLIEVPSFRHDIETNNDLSEEVARVVGYENIQTKKITLPKVNKKSYLYENNVKEFLIDKGFYEVINFPFVDKKNKNSIAIDNSIDANKRFLRTSLKESLINNLSFNERRQNDSIRFFEISNIYKKNNDNEKRIGIIVSGRLGHNYKEFSKKITRDYLRSILEVISIEEDIEIFEIQRSLVDSKSNYPIFYAEFSINNNSKMNENYELTNKLRLHNNFPIYSEISDYPSTSRDLSFAMNSEEDYKKLQKFLLDYKTELLKEIFIFDFFVNKDGQIKIGYRFVIQSKNKTLNDIEINEIMNDIISKCMAIGDIEIPGLK